MSTQFLTATALSVSLASCNSYKSASAEKPNIIIILADDLGYNDISCYGSKEIHTPNLDILAAEGMLFSDFHSNCSVCSPTRAALLTGRYQHRTGIVNVMGQISAALPMIQGLPKGSITVANVLNESGYQTAMFGKWHLGNFSEFHPLDFGFDYFFGVEGGMGNPFTYLPANPGPATKSMLFRNRERVNGPGPYFTFRLVDEVINYVENRNQEKPFFIYLPFTAPHLPLWKPGDSLTIWDGNKLGPHPDDLESAYRETIEALDSAVGNIIKMLRKTGLDKNTLVFFTSDNGPVDVGSCKPYRGRKTNLYEGGTRVPAIAWWPGKIQPGIVCDELAATMDIFPTLTSIAGIPADPSLKLDGIDITNLFLKDGKLPERMIFWEKPVGVEMSSFQIRREAVRYGKWKLVRDRSGKELELYDLENDTAENTDLSSEYPDKVKELSQAFMKWKAEVYADSPVSLDEMINTLEENGTIKKRQPVK